MLEPISHVIPHTHLLDELAITLIPINLQLRHVSLLLKWLAAIQEADDQNITHPINWISALNPKWATQTNFLFEEKIQGLIHLQDFINDIEKPLTQLMELITDFSPFKEIQTAIYNLQQGYSEIPYIETEVAMLSNECNLLEQTELLPTLFYYLDKVSTFVMKVDNLKQATLNAAIQSASCHLFHQADAPFYLPSNEYGEIAE